ncbi:MAG: PKD domain-containing protein [Proteobacteria bacterium]|nr:PKD domain-containing protein [Pseudomonadota bacterium]
MLRFFYMLVCLFFLSPGLVAQDQIKQWSYPYGDSQVSLVQDNPAILAILVDPAEEDPAQLISNLVRASKNYFGSGKAKAQEYPGLFYIPLEKKLDKNGLLKLTEVLASSPGIVTAAPLLHIDQADIITRPELIVTFDGSVEESDIREILNTNELRPLRTFSGLDPTYLVSFKGSPMKAFELSWELLGFDEVSAAEPNFIQDLPEMATPNDSLYANQWDMNNTGQTGGTPGADMHMSEAWDISTGSASIVVAIIDEGVDVDHPDLIANMVTGFDAVTADPTPEGVPGNANSGDGHGTCCAGIVAADGNNGLGVTGVTWNSKIMPIRIGFGNFWTQTDWIIDGLTWPVDNGADVLSNSWGGGGASTAIQNAVSYGTTTGRGGLGCPNFFASGNDNGGVSYPAAYPEAIAVGASSPCDERKSPSSCDGETWWGSNFGSTLDFVAPGPLTTTVDIAGSGGYSSGDYTTSFNGTSSATPHAAGAGALLLAVAPGLTESEVRTLMRQTADDQVGPPSEDTPGFDIYMGYGRVNCESLLLAVASNVPGPTGLSCNNSGVSTVLSWNNGASYTQVTVSRNGSVLATLSGGSTSYTDGATPTGTSSYAVRGYQGADFSYAASCSIFSIGDATDLVWAPSAAGGAVSRGQGLADALTAAGRSPLLVASLNDVSNLDIFEAVWVNLGIYPSNHVLSSGESSQLDSYLTNGTGGSFLYLEGGDTWAYDTSTTVHGRFGISGQSDGTADLSTVTGAPGAGCDLAGNSWSYGGENNWIDRLGTTGSGVVSLINPSPSYNVGIFNDAGSYKTFGASFEIAGLNDGASSRADLVSAILTCFAGVAPPPPPPAPVADFSATPTSGEVPLNVSFGNLTSGDVTGYSWSFGDGNVSSGNNPSHTYTSAGVYTVILTATGPGGSDTATCSACITVNDPPPPPAPVADFSVTPTSGETPLFVSMTNETTGDVTGYSWDFGDGGGSTASDPSHTYSSPGVYTITLTATGPGGSDTAICLDCVIVSDPPPPPAPVADFVVTPNSGDAPLVVAFVNMSLGDIDSYLWDFGDGNSSTASDPNHTYTASGLYDVTLTVNGPGGSDTAVCNNCITVTDPPPPPPSAPIADFSVSQTSGEAPVTIDFTNLTTGDVTGYQWDFGDGNGSTATDPSYTYTVSGSYTVTLTAIGPGGSDTAICNNCITVTDPPPPPPPAPVADFVVSPISGNAPLTVSFSNLTIGDVTGYQWDFGDGNGSTANEPNHTYTSVGTYTVTLIATGPGGSDTAVCNACVTVTDPPPPPAPVADFSLTPSSGDSPVVVSFTNLSSGDISGYAWDFGDGGSSTAANPSHTYSIAGTYSITLVASGPGGSDTAICNACVTVTDPPPPPPSTELYYLSFVNNTAVTGVGTVRDEDIVSYDPATGQWALFIDGSDIGIGGTDINALSVLADGSVVLSINSGGYTLFGITDGPDSITVDDSDLLLFTPTSTGANTAGSWSFFFDGSDVSLTSNGEDIDGVCVLDDGSFLFSTLGTAKGGGPNSHDENVALFTPTSLGAATSGSWSIFFDGSDVGFGGNGAEDLDAVSLDFDGTLIFSTVGDYSGAGSTGADEDISRFTGTFGAATSGSAQLILDLTTLGINASEDVDGFSIR